MGCDGGTIPKRNEVVKTKQQTNSKDKNADKAAQWQTCALSGMPLRKPIVACQLGRLYNKEAVLEYLLRRKSSKDPANEIPTVASHIRSLRDVKELSLKEKKDHDKEYQASSGSEQFRSQFVCPISGLELNGKYKFYCIFSCGCVLSERALKEVPNNSQCLLCHKTYDSERHLIELNGDHTEMNLLQENLAARKRRKVSNKRLLDGTHKDVT